MFDKDGNDDNISRAINRRQFLKISGAAVAAIPLTGLLSACATSEPEKVVYAGWGGTYEKAMIEAQFSPFEEGTGIDVVTTTGAGEFQKIRTMVESGKTKYDLIDATGPTYGQLLSYDLIEEMDQGIVKGKQFADPKSIDRYSFPQFAYGHCIFWNAEYFDEPMKNWRDVWDVKRFPGTRAFQKLPYYVLEEALMADGVEPSQLYPLDIERALKKLDEIRPHAEFTNLNTIQNLIAQGEVVTGDLNLARTQALIADGAPLEYTWNQNIVDYVRWGVPKGAPHSENAWKLIEASLHPKRQLKVLDLLGYTPTLTEALDDLTVEQRQELAGTPETLDKGVVLNPHYYREHGEEARTAFHNWLVKG